MSRSNWVSLVSISIVALGASMTGALAASDKPHMDASKPAIVIYPKLSQSNGEQGSVVLNVYVRANGKPSRIGVAKSSGYSDLDNAAAQTAMNWNYIPAASGEADWTTVQIIYKLPETASVQ
jgi:protein TonB